jgi:hypothetical protein
MTDTVAEFIAGLMKTETWRDVPGFPGYCVSSYGVVRGPRCLLAPVQCSKEHRYLVVSLRCHGRTHTRRVHKLVAEAFLGAPPFMGAQVAHNDGNPFNNRLSNLRWTSGQDNQHDRKRHGTWIRGSMMKHAKIAEADIPIIYDRAARGENYKSIASDYRISVSTVSLIRRRRIWRHALPHEGATS